MTCRAVDLGRDVDWEDRVRLWWVSIPILPQCNLVVVFIVSLFLAKLATTEENDVVFFSVCLFVCLFLPVFSDSRFLVPHIVAPEIDRR